MKRLAIAVVVLLALLFAVLPIAALAAAPIRAGDCVDVMFRNGWAPGGVVVKTGDVFVVRFKDRLFEVTYPASKVRPCSKKSP